MRELKNNTTILCSYGCGQLANFQCGRNPDFIDEERKLIIDLFGDYWHGEEFRLANKDFSTNLEHEQNRINHFKNHGYDCLIIWEHELKDLDQVIQKIKNFTNLKELILW